MSSPGRFTPGNDQVPFVQGAANSCKWLTYIMEMNCHRESPGLTGRQTQENKGDFFKKYCIIKRAENK
jgi:hypothetical protein